MKKGLLFGTGFLLFTIGLTSLFLGLSGIYFSFLKFIEGFGTVYALSIKIFMVFMGVVIAYIGFLETEFEDEA